MDFAPRASNTLARVKRTALLVVLAPLVLGCDDDDHYGPYWSGRYVVPEFTLKQNSLSTSFSGAVHPETYFELGREDGLAFGKPNARLTVNASAVWQYAPIYVALYDGRRESIGSSETLIVDWVLPPPERGAGFEVVDSQPLSGRNPEWAVVDFVDFSGNCVLEVLGHD